MPGANLAGLLDGPARALADAPAIVVGQRTQRDWRGLADAVARRAAGLQAAFGVRPGDRVALYAANHPAYLEALFAVWHAGAVAVPISSRLHPREAELLVAASGARACLTTQELDDVSLLANEPVAMVPRGPGDDAWIFFTSGTTGRPKGARLTHGNLLAMAAAHTADVQAIDPRDALIQTAALSHASGLFALPFLARGATQVLPESGRFEPAELVALINARERSSFFVAPTALRRLCASPELSALRAERIGTVFVGAAPVRAEDLRAGVAALGPRLWNGFGQGESPCTITAMSRASIAAAIDAGDDEWLTSVGVARWATRVRVVDADDAELAPGEVGEVVVDGPTVMAGYLDDPDATAQTLRGGWLHTGDLGRFDARGRLTLVDRAKDVVISGGENVYSREVEDVLATHPAVADVAIVGLPDPEWGERVTAFVVTAGAALDTAQLDAHCLQRIARHKRPQEYHAVDELPRNAAGKVLKAQLRDGVLHA